MHEIYVVEWEVVMRKKTRTNPHTDRILTALNQFGDAAPVVEAMVRAAHNLGCQITDIAIPKPGSLVIEVKTPRKCQLKELLAALERIDAQVVDMTRPRGRILLLYVELGSSTATTGNSPEVKSLGEEVRKDMAVTESKGPPEGGTVDPFSTEKTQPGVKIPDEAAPPPVEMFKQIADLRDFLVKEFGDEISEVRAFDIAEKAIKKGLTVEEVMKKLEGVPRRVRSLAAPLPQALPPVPQPSEPPPLPDAEDAMAELASEPHTANGPAPPEVYRAHSLRVGEFHSDEGDPDPNEPFGPITKEGPPGAVDQSAVVAPAQSLSPAATPPPLPPGALMTRVTPLPTKATAPLTTLAQKAGALLVDTLSGAAPAPVAVREYSLPRSRQKPPRADVEPDRSDLIHTLPGFAALAESAVPQVPPAGSGSIPDPQGQPPPLPSSDAVPVELAHADTTPLSTGAPPGYTGGVVQVSHQETAFADTVAVESAPAPDPDAPRPVRPAPSEETWFSEYPATPSEPTPALPPTSVQPDPDPFAVQPDNDPPAPDNSMSDSDLPAEQTQIVDRSRHLPPEGIRSGRRGGDGSGRRFWIGLAVGIVLTLVFLIGGGFTALTLNHSSARNRAQARCATNLIDAYKISAVEAQKACSDDGHGRR